MNPRIIVAALCSMLLAAAATPALAQTGDKTKPEAKAGKADEHWANIKCPLMDEPVDKDAYTYYKGQRVYFCCKKCIAKFEKDPDKYADAVKKQWELTKPLRVQIKCPVTGKPVDSKVFVEGEFARVYFADDASKAAWEKKGSPALADDCYTFQTACPVSGNPIDPTATATVDGRTIYFCCSKCPAGFEKDKAANLKKLDEQIKKNQEAWAKHQKAPEKKPG